MHKCSLWIDDILYDSVTEAETITGVKYGTIVQRCDRITFPNYRWCDPERAESRKIDVKPRVSTRGKYSTVGEVSVEGIIYPNATYAAEELGMSRQNLWNRIRSRNFPEYFILDKDKHAARDKGSVRKHYNWRK